MSRSVVEWSESGEAWSVLECTVGSCFGGGVGVVYGCSFRDGGVGGGGGGGGSVISVVFLTRFPSGTCMGEWRKKS